MTATLDDVTSRKRKPEPSAEQLAAEELVARAREQGLSLTGPGGLLKQLTVIPGCGSLTATRPTGAGCAGCAAAAAGAGCVAGVVAVCPALAGRKMTAASEPSRAAAMAASTAVSEPVMKACWAAWARIWPPALCDRRAAVSAAPREPVARAEPAGRGSRLAGRGVGNTEGATGPL